MMVSLDHTIYFHDPRGFRADEWMITEMDSPWAADGRGLVTEKIFTREGKLIASCFQEVLIFPFPLLSNMLFPPSLRLWSFRLIGW